MTVILQTGLVQQACGKKKGESELYSFCVNCKCVLECADQQKLTENVNKILNAICCSSCHDNFQIRHQDRGILILSVCFRLPLDHSSHNNVNTHFL